MMIHAPKLSWRSPMTAVCAVFLLLICMSTPAAADEPTALHSGRLDTRLRLIPWPSTTRATARRLALSPLHSRSLLRPTLRSPAAPRYVALAQRSPATSAWLQETKVERVEAEMAKIESGEADLAKTSQNPVGDLISVPFQNNTNFGAGPHERTVNVMNIQPVIPIEISSSWNLITRTIIPLFNQPHLESSEGTTFGLGDISPTLFLTPAKPGKVIWGVGPTFFLPTATDDRLGTGKFSLGPSVVALTMPGKFVLGIIVSNFWSVAGDSKRANVNGFFSQVFVNYNFPGGWFLTSAPIITANWKAASGNRWTVPVGGGVGRVTKIGSQPISVTVQAYYNVARPTGGPEWQLRLQLALLFPKKK